MNDNEQALGALNALDDVMSRIALVFIPGGQNTVGLSRADQTNILGCVATIRRALQPAPQPACLPAPPNPSK